MASSTAEFNLPAHDVFMPIASNYNLIERALVECSYAGCESIWIVCNDDIAPLLKEKLGDYVGDMVSVERGSYVNFPDEVKISIPIYYVPIHPKHRDKIDCYAWSILHGANVAYWICRRLSRWMIPDRYYVSFPFGVYDPAAVKKKRKQIASRKPFYFSYKQKTVCDGLPIGFTFDSAEWKRARDIIKSNSKMYYPPAEGELMPSKRLPSPERYKSKYYKLQDVFRGADLSVATINELSWFYDLTTWEKYCILLSSTHREDLKRPSGFVSGHLRGREEE